MKKINSWTIGFGVLLIGALAVIAFSGKGAGGGVLTGEAALLYPVEAGEHTKGAENPVVTLVEYSDFQCPACAAYAPVVAQLIAEFSDSLALVYRHFPLRAIHPNAEMAGRAAEAAAKQGAFFAMHDALFATQSEWSRMPNPQATFVSHAELLGLDAERFLEDMKSDEAGNAVAENERQARAMRLSGTPTFYLNGRLISNPASYEAFRALIEAEIAAAN